MTILLLIRSLEPGGAERQLVTLANGLSARGHVVHLAVFYGGGALEADLHGPTLHVIGKGGRWDVAGFLLRLRRLIRQVRPDVLHGYLGTANLLATLLRPFTTRYKAVWGLRASNMDLRRYGLLARLHWRMECLLSPWADLIIVNSQAGKAHALTCGFAPSRLEVAPNGMDTGRFQPDSSARAAIRRAWGIPEQSVLIGCAARLDPMKDHDTLLRAFALLSEQRSDCVLVCIGGGRQDAEDRLRELAGELGISSRLIWAGQRQDMPEVYNALDLCVLGSAFGEGFPNVLGEAMSSGVPCVATDVGDSAVILGDLGMVVPPRNPAALAQAMQAMLERSEREGQGLRDRLRARIQERFSLERMVERSEGLLLRLLEY